ncbi:MAG: hypothetical protein WA151_17305, partial [Desulfatirhabdiaceae bacterium]
MHEIRRYFSVKDFDIKGHAKAIRNIAFKIKILGALSVGDGKKSLSSPCCLPKIIILKAIDT